jgi:ABC-type transport system substrate-binding protein
MTGRSVLPRRAAMLPRVAGMLLLVALSACQSAAPTSPTSAPAPTTAPAKPTVASAPAASPAVAASPAAKPAASPAAAPAASPAASPVASVVAAAAAVSPPLAAAPPAGKRGGTLILARQGEATNLDPQKVPAFSSQRVFELVYSRLTSLTADLTVQPDLAESWTVSGDGKTYTFKLRQAKWHNGDPLT